MARSKALSIMTQASVGFALALPVCLAAPVASAAETRSFVVSWFYPSISTQSAAKDCPQGTNPDASGLAMRVLKEQGKSPAEIEKIMEGFPNTVYAYLGMRGRIDGKPVSPYVNPTSVPDPNLKSVEGKYALGFNLDGNEATGGFIDPTTNEKGVDNQLFRTYGCSHPMRADPNARPTWFTIQWQTVQQQMPAWIIEVSGIDDLKNDPEVEVRLVQATRPVILAVNAEPQADMTFYEDNNPATKNTVRGQIKDGGLVTEKFKLNMLGHRWAWPELHFRDARVRLNLAADGTAKGIVAGFHKWLPLYLPQAEGGAGYEGMLSMDLPGMYYAFRKLADADPDPVTHINTTISTAFTVELLPAYLVRAKSRGVASAGN